MIKNFFQQWDTWWCREAPPHALAIFRIAFGTFILLYVLPFGFNIKYLFSNEGIVQPFFSYLNTPLPEMMYMPPSPFVATCIFLFFIVALLCFTVGFAYRAATLSIILLLLYYWNLNLFLFLTSYLRIFLTTFIVMFISSADKTFSVRMIRERGSFFAWEPITILPQRILAVQVTMTYLVVGWQKIILADWQSGEILSYSYIGFWATPLAFWTAKLNFPMWVYDVKVELVKYWEMLVAFGLWYRPTQKFFFVTAFLFHFVISLYLAIWWFMIVPAYFIFFVPPENVYNYCKRLSKGRIT